MEHYFGEAKKAGATDDEIEVVQSVIMSLAGCKVRSQFQEVRDRMNKNKQSSL
jgi:alkylhydroperoxidase/carboxymuconolactone decarboxylase family protein YurZ